MSSSTIQNQLPAAATTTTTTTTTTTETTGGTSARFYPIYGCNLCPDLTFDRVRIGKSQSNKYKSLQYHVEQKHPGTGEWNSLKVKKGQKARSAPREKAAQPQVVEGEGISDDVAMTEEGGEGAVSVEEGGEGMISVEEVRAAMFLETMRMRSVLLEVREHLDYEDSDMKEEFKAFIRDL